MPKALVYFQVNWFATDEGLSDYAVFTNTPWTILFFFIMLYLIGVISLCFMFSSFFSSGKKVFFYSKFLPILQKLNNYIIARTNTHIYLCLWCLRNVQTSFGLIHGGATLFCRHKNVVNKNISF